MAAGDYSLATTAGDDFGKASESLSLGVPFKQDGAVVKGEEMRGRDSGTLAFGDGMMGGGGKGAAGGVPLADQVPEGDWSISLA